MRELMGHKVNECNEAITIKVLDEPGAGGANHGYLIQGFDLSKNPSAGDGEKQCGGTEQALYFQNGPIKEVGVNGVTEQALIAILLDRLRAFQAGPYSCRENAIALTNLEQCEMWLHQRTRNRVARGVEGTHEK